MGRERNSVWEWAAAGMFHVIDFDADGRATKGTDIALVAPPKEGRLRWIDLTDQDAEKLSVLSDEFGFHPLAIEDCLHFGQRPKLEPYDDHLFLVIHGIQADWDSLEVTESVELHIFLGDRFLVTVHQSPIPEIERVLQRATQDAIVTRRGLDYLCYMLADAIVDSYFPILDKLLIRVDQLEERILSDGDDVELAEMAGLKQMLVSLRRVLLAQRDVLSQLSRHSGSWISDETALYFRDVYDHVVRLSETVDSAREMLSNTRDAYMWSASQRTNEIMKRLTILSAIFLPLTFITGFFGQNFDDLPYGSNTLMNVMLLACLLVPALMFGFFLKSKWFS